MKKESLLDFFYKNIIFKFSKTILLILVIITIILGNKATNLQIDASSDTLVLENDLDLKYYQTLNKRYESQDFLVIAFTPVDELLSKKTQKVIANLSDDLLKIKQIDSINSILNVPLLLSSKKSLSDILEGVPTLSDDLVDLSSVKKEFLSSPLYRENLVSANFKTTAILINLTDNKKLKLLREKKEQLKKKDANKNLSEDESVEYKSILKDIKKERDISRSARSDLISSVRSTIKQYSSHGEFYLGGIPMIANDVVDFVKSDLKIFGISILIFLIIALFIIFKQYLLVLLPIITCSFSVIITAGIFSIFSWEVTVISSNFISLQLILTMAITIHLIVRYRELVKKHLKLNQKDLILKTISQMVLPCFFTVITTIAGFSSLILSDLLPVINFGWMMSVGVSISLLLTFILFPILLVRFDKLSPNFSFEKKFNLPKVFANLTKRYSQTILVISFSILIFSFYGISQLKVENSFIDYFKSNTEIHKGMKVIDQQLGGTTILDVTLDFKEKNDNKISNAPYKGDEDFDDFDDLFSELEEENSDPKYWFTKDKMNKIEKLHDHLDNMDETGKVLSFATILKTGRLLNNGKDLDSVQLALLYEKLSPEYKKIILDPYISTEHNQARVTLRVKDSDPSLRRNDLIKKINETSYKAVDVNKDQLKLSNILILYNNMLQSLFKSQILTLGIVIIVLFSMFFILFRSFKISLIALFPNLLSIGSVLGLMGTLNISLDMMTITIAAISMGIAVDNTIHYIYRHKIEFNKTKSYDQAMSLAHMSIGYALYYTTLTIIVGFSILVFSNFIPSIYFGLLTSLAMLIALLATLTLVPKMLTLLKPY